MKTTTASDVTQADKKRGRGTKRRGNGEGSIFQRNDGRWSARITVGYGADGKRKTLPRRLHGFSARIRPGSSPSEGDSGDEITSEGDARAGGGA